MQAMKTTAIDPEILYFGTPVAVLSTRNPDGTANLAALSSFWALADRFVIGLAPGGQTGVNLAREDECVLNLPSPGQWAEVERLGRTTGRPDMPAYKKEAGFRYERDKFGWSGFTPLPSELVSPPRVAECPVQIEARVVARHRSVRVGEADPGLHYIELQRLKVHAQDRILNDEKRRIDIDEWSPLLYLFRHYFGKGRRLGVSFRAKY